MVEYRSFLQVFGAAYRASTSDTAGRSVDVTFSSEEMVQRAYGWELLSHAPGAVDLARLDSGRANVLVNHDRGDWVGVVERAWVSNRRGLATVRFGNSPRAQSVFLDVADDILQSVSVGYQVLDAKVTGRTEEGEEVLTVTRWQPFEISLVTIPADESVGVGRDAARGRASTRSLVAALRIRQEQRRLLEARANNRAEQAIAKYQAHARGLARRNGGFFGGSWYN